MFKILWFFLLSLVTAIITSSILDANGTVVVRWLGYELRTDVITTILISALTLFLVSFISYIVAKLLAASFPIFSRARNIDEKLKRSSYDEESTKDIIDSILLLRTNPKKSLKTLDKSEHTNENLSAISDALRAVSLYESKKFSQALSHFLKVENLYEGKTNKTLEIMILKSKIKSDSEHLDDATKIKYAKDILEISPHDEEAIEILNNHK